MERDDTCIVLLMNRGVGVGVGGGRRRHTCRSTYRMVNISRLLILLYIDISSDVGLYILFFTVMFATDTGGFKTPPPWPRGFCDP